MESDMQVWILIMVPCPPSLADASRIVFLEREEMV